MASERGDGSGGTLEPSAEAEDLIAGGLRSGGLVQVQRAGLPDADQPDIATSDDGRKETGTGSVKPGPGLSGPPVLEDLPIFWWSF